MTEELGVLTNVGIRVPVGYKAEPVMRPAVAGDIILIMRKGMPCIRTWQGETRSADAYVIVHKQLEFPPLLRKALLCRLLVKTGLDRGYYWTVSSTVPTWDEKNRRWVFEPNDERFRIKEKFFRELLEEPYQSVHSRDSLMLHPDWADPEDTPTDALLEPNDWHPVLGEYYYIQFVHGNGERVKGKICELRRSEREAKVRTVKGNFHWVGYDQLWNHDEKGNDVL